MYEIYKDGVRISIEDKARFVKLQSNGTYCLCDEPEAHGVVVNNEYICHLEGKPPIPVAETVSIVEINGSALFTDALAALTELGYVEGGESNGEYLEWSQRCRLQLDSVISEVNDTPKSINDMSLLVRAWQAGTSGSPIYYAAGEVRSENGNPYKCCQAHTHSGEAGWNPSAAPALWAQYHGTS